MSTKRIWLKHPKSWRVGDVRITRVVEQGGSPIHARFFLKGATTELVQSQTWLQPHFANEDGELYGVCQAFVLESQGRRILVDTCIGNHKVRSVPMFDRQEMTFLADLGAAGFSPQSFDLILCTHLHVDHVGWNTRLENGRWIPTFPQARCLFGREEWEHWTADGVVNPDGDVFGDSVKPVVDAGLVDFVETHHVVTDEVRLIPTPGHTPGHVSVVIASRGRKAIITGDLMHHPIQCAAPDMYCEFDSDGEAARVTRRKFLAAYADAPVAIFGTHFPHPTGGWIRRRGDTWEFDVGPSVDGTELTLSANGDAWESVAPDEALGTA